MTRTIQTSSHSAHDLRGTRKEAIEIIESMFQEVPEAYREEAELEIQSGISCDMEYCDLYVSYKRPETEKETQARKDSDKKKQERAEAAQRAEYERLKAKFENK